MACGRRTGKTLGAVYMTVEHLTTNPEHVGYWVAPTYGLTRKGLRETLRFLRGFTGLGVAVSRAEKRIEFSNGSFLEFHTADNPDSLVSEGLDWLVVDEAGLIADKEVWTGRLRPALADREGRALFISSPRGRNWFYDVYMHIRDDGTVDPNWESWNIPTLDGGFVKPGELLDIKGSTPDRIFRQEYLAEFIEGEGSVFRKVDAAIAPSTARRSFVVLGLDLARVRDWTVVWATNELGEWIEYDRFQNVDWAIQKPRIVNMYKKYKASRVVIDATAVHVYADPLIDELRREGLAVEPINLTGAEKSAIISNAMVRFDNGAVTLPNDPVVLDEFKRYTYTPLPSGRDRYSAPNGENDDIVMAACLAWWGIRQFAGRMVQRPVVTEVEREIKEALAERNAAGRNPWLS